VNAISRLPPNSQNANLGNIIYTPWAHVYRHFNWNKLQPKQLKAIKLYKIHIFWKQIINQRGDNPWIDNEIILVFTYKYCLNSFFNITILFQQKICSDSFILSKIFWLAIIIERVFFSQREVIWVCNILFTPQQPRCRPEKCNLHTIVLSIHTFIHISLK